MASGIFPERQAAKDSARNDRADSQQDGPAQVHSGRTGKNAYMKRPAQNCISHTSGRSCACTTCHPRRSQRVHINRTGKKAVRNWQYRFKKQIHAWKRTDLSRSWGDEAFFIHDTVSGRKYWSPRGKRIAVPYTGSHKKVTVYGAIAKDGKQFLSDVRSVRRAYLYRVSQGDAEAFWKGSGSSGQGLSASRKICQGIAAGKQEHQDHIPSKRVAVPQCGRRVLASGKASSARLRILQDLHGHVQCNLYVL